VELFARDARIAFRLELTPGLPTVVVDREEMRRALINVLRNGVQAMGGEGNVIVQTGRCPMGVSVAITDHGSGMTAEVRARLFQPNFSTKTDGMGLGLAIVKKTIDDLGGTIRINSVVGQGTTVTMELPEQAPGGAEAVDAP
jgi:signal transduction histidine kinase